MQVPKPLYRNILVKREEEEKYVGSIILPDTSKERPMGALVIAVGPECEVIKAGDSILCGKYAGADIRFNNEDYIVLREVEVLARMETEDAN